MNYRSKYKSRKITIDGITFDSLKEANRWKELKLLENAGEITELKRQVKFKLIPTQREPCTEVKPNGAFVKGKIIEHECSYIADFVYKSRLGFEIVEDVKGYKTEAYKIKRKLMLYIHHIRIHEV